MYTTTEGRKFCSDSGASTPLQQDDHFGLSPQTTTSPDDLIKMGLLDDYVNPGNILDGTMRLPSVDTPKGLSDMRDFSYPQMYQNALPLQSYPLFADSYSTTTMNGQPQQYNETQQYNCNLSNGLIVPYPMFTDGMQYTGDSGTSYEGTGYTDDSLFPYANSGVHFQGGQIQTSSGQRPRSTRSYNRRRHSVSHSGDLDDTFHDSGSSTSRHLTSEKKRRAAINQLYSTLETKVGFLIEGKSSKAKILHAAASLMDHYKQKLTQNNVPY